MRSESDGHCLPTSFPGLAVRAARRRPQRPAARPERVRPLPPDRRGVPRSRRRAARACRLGRRRRPRRVERIEAVDSGFTLDGAGHFRHVLVAVGHPGLNVPDELAGDPRVVHAYEPHEYADDVAVLGAGMAAATEWRNALAAGARVTSVRRREPSRRPLNVPRPLLSRRGLASVPRRRPGRARREIAGGARPVVPARARVGRAARARGRPLPCRRRAERRGPDHLRHRLPAAASAASRCSHSSSRTTGSRPTPSWLVLDPDCTVPALTGDDRTLALAGVAAQWAYPAADTLDGREVRAHTGSCAG